MSSEHLAIRLITILVWAAGASAVALAQGRGGASVSFDLESPMASTPLPQAALRLLSSHEDVRDRLEGSSQAETAAALKAFEAAAVDINSDGRKDFVVRNSRLNGANIGPFWILVRNARGYKVAFFTRSLGITVLKTARRGWHDLRASSATAVVLSEAVYRFNGRAYEARECSQTDLITGKKTRLRCYRGPRTLSL